MNIFERASRAKLSFSTVNGVIRTDDLWDLPLKSATTKANLNSIAQAINRELRAADEESFVETAGASGGQTRNQLKLDIVKHVISVKLAQDAETAERSAKAEKRQKIMAAMERQEDDSIAKMSKEELQTLLAGLG